MAPAQESSTSLTKEISSVPLLDVGRGNKKRRQEILQKIGEVYDAGCFVYGPDCRELESRIAEISSAKYAIGCASGSEALLVALMAHDIGPGDEGNTWNCVQRKKYTFGPVQLTFHPRNLFSKKNNRAGRTFKS